MQLQPTATVTISVSTPQFKNNATKANVKTIKFPMEATLVSA